MKRVSLKERMDVERSLQEVKVRRDCSMRCGVMQLAHTALLAQNDCEKRVSRAVMERELLQKEFFELEARMVSTEGELRLLRLKHANLQAKSEELSAIQPQLKECVTPARYAGLGVC